MRISKDAKVQSFLQGHMMASPEQYEILQMLREIVFNQFPATKERMMYGGIMFSLEDDYGGIFVRKKHISFEFSMGTMMNDPEKHLEGTGKLRRHLKIRTSEDINEKQVTFFVNQALKMD